MTTRVNGFASGAAAVAAALMLALIVPGSGVAAPPAPHHGAHKPGEAPPADEVPTTHVKLSALLAPHFDKTRVDQVVSQVNQMFDEEWKRRPVEQEPVASTTLQPSPRNRHLH